MGTSKSGQHVNVSLSLCVSLSLTRAHTGLSSASGHEGKNDLLHQNKRSQFKKKRAKANQLQQITFQINQLQQITFQILTM